MVEHGGNAIKSEAVKAVLLHPPAQVWQQEAQHFPAGETHKQANTHKKKARTDTHTYTLKVR